MNKVKTRPRVILYTCNWHALSSFEAVGSGRSSYAADLVPIRLPCLGRISTGIILKAFEYGAGGVLLLGCPEDQCHFQGGNRQALKVVTEARGLLRLLGYNESLVAYHLLPADRGEECLEVLDDFLEIVQNGWSKP